jgi:hypothetical protein
MARAVFGRSAFTRRQRIFLGIPSHADAQTHRLVMPALAAKLAQAAQYCLRGHPRSWLR